MSNLAVVKILEIVHLRTIAGRKRPIAISARAAERRCGFARDRTCRAGQCRRRGRDRSPGSSSLERGRPPPRHYSYVPVPQLRSLSIPWLLAGGRTREDEARREGGRWVGGCVSPQNTNTASHACAMQPHGMHSIRTCRYPPRGKRFLHRAINV